MAQNVIPKRSEVPEEFTWNLKDMFESDEAWFAEYEALKEMPARIAAFQASSAGAPKRCLNPSALTTR